MSDKTNFVRASGNNLFETERVSFGARVEGGVQNNLKRNGVDQKGYGNNPAILFAGTQSIDTSRTVKANLLAEVTSGGVNLDDIQGVRGNRHVTAEFKQTLISIARRISTKPEWLLAVMSFETASTFSPSIRNRTSDATGLIQFLPTTARGLGTSIDALARMSSVQQLRFVEKYFQPFKGNLKTLEAVYTAVLSGRPRPNPSTVLFSRGTGAYSGNSGLDINNDGRITTGEATTPVAAKLFGGVARVQQRLINLGLLKIDRPTGNFGPVTSSALKQFQRTRNLPATGLLNEATGRALFNPSGTRPGPRPVSSPVPTAALDRGDRGAQVKKLQDLLIKFGHITQAQVNTGPGIFGQRTENATKAFQRANNLTVNGKYDGPTRTAMKNILDGVRRGDTGKIVRGLQERLTTLRYMTRAQVNTGPGIFGAQTQAALRRFQTDHHLGADGVLGPKTYNALQKARIRGGTGGSGNIGGSSLPNGRPVNGGRITSRFGYRIHPRTGQRRLHTGIDIGGLRVGTRINTTGKGKVVFAGKRGGYGNLVIVDHGNGYRTYYAHMSRISVRRGQNLNDGQKVGELGATGNVTGPHLHYEVRRNGVAINPAPFMNR